MTQHLYISRIGELLPDLFFNQVEQTSGQFHDVLVVNSEWVFRFPRYREGVDQLIAEIELLKALQEKLPLAVPRPVVYSFDPPVPGLAVAGYRLIPGEPVTAEALNKIGHKVRDSLAGQLAGFLRALHDLPLVDLPPRFPGGFPEDAFAGAAVRDMRPEWEAMYSAVTQKLFPSMRPDACKAVTEHFETYLDEPRLQKFTPCLRHGDFGGENILWQRASGQAFGVIDFSFCAVGDPAMDLASVSTLGRVFFDHLAQQYETDPRRRDWLLARACFYRGTFALMEALDGLRYGDEEAYRRGIAGYV